MNESAALECGTDVGLSDGSKLFRFVVHGVLLNGIGAAGLLGNALAVAVLSRPQMRSSTNCLLIGLAACDTLLILTSMLLFGFSAFYPYTGLMRDYYTRVCPLLTPYAYPLANAAQTMSVYLTLVVTLERWVAVCHPFRAKALCTAARARWYVLGTAAFALAYNAPRFLEVRMSVRGAPGARVWCVEANTAFRTERYVAVYTHWLYLLIMYALPFSALAALNLCIVRQVRRAQAERARLSRGQRRELGLATMLLAVVLVFFLCNLLPLVTNAFEAFLDEEFNDLDPLVKTSNLLVTLNSSVNFLIYVIFGEKFKRVFLKTFCARRVRMRGRGGDSPEHTRDDSLSAAAERVSLRTTRSTTLRRSERRSLGAGGAGGTGAAGGVGGAAGGAGGAAPGRRSPAPAALYLPPAPARWNGHATHY